MPEENQEKNLPQSQNYNCCPKCGSQERLARRIALDLVARGKMKAEAVEQQHVLKSVNPIIDPRSVPLIAMKVPVVMTFFDVCLKCGTLYPIYYEIVDGMVGNKGGNPLGVPPQCQ